MKFTVAIISAFVASAMSTPTQTSAALPSITVTAFPDLECAEGPGVELVFAQNGCGTLDTAFQSVRLPKSLPEQYQDQANAACGLIFFDDGLENCRDPDGVNLIDPNLALGECVPTLIFGNFAGPQPAQAITLQCSPFI
ncbi:hypothetical protein V8C35DRAFT_285504 [Trichoderma chlorosporum]